MKNILTSFLIVLAFNVSAQYQNGLKIDPNQDKSKQYIGMSSNGKQILGKKNRPLGTHETKGSFKSVLLTDFADAIGNYIDSMGLITIPASSDSANVFNEPVSKNRISDFNDYDLTIDDIDVFKLRGNGGTEYFSMYYEDPEYHLHSFYDLGIGSNGAIIIQPATQFSVSSATTDISSTGSVSVASSAGTASITAGGDYLYLGALNNDIVLFSGDDVGVTSSDDITIDALDQIILTGKVVIPTATPASAGATGVTGQIAWDASFIYICTATNTWKRIAISTW